VHFCFVFSPIKIRVFSDHLKQPLKCLETWRSKHASGTWRRSNSAFSTWSPRQSRTATWWSCNRKTIFTIYRPAGRASWSSEKSRQFPFDISICLIRTIHYCHFASLFRPLVERDSFKNLQNNQSCIFLVVVRLTWLCVAIYRDLYV